MRHFPYIVTLFVFLAACSSGATIPATETETETTTKVLVATTSPTETLQPGETPIPTSSSTATLSPDAWKSMPVVPTGVSMHMIDVYQRGLALGRDPNRFSKFGDCQNVPSVFLSIFDTGNYRLGEQYAYLQPTIDHFAGSWERASYAVKGGMNVAAVQTLYFTDPVHCKNDSPMVCEIRTNNPSIVLISFETWWAGKPASDYETRLRAVVEYVLSKDVVPILATKADNLEGDNSINSAIARVAYEFGVPLWNFWAATYPLPNHGLFKDGYHLTIAQDIFDDPVRMQSARPWRNLTALQVIDAVWRGVSEQH
jgi:hypothetical protein